MFTDLNVFKLAHAMALHAGKRQAVIAGNIANADTPGFRARDIEPFSQFLASQPAPTRLQSHRTGHLPDRSGADRNWSSHVVETSADPNGNSVSVELELLKATDVKRQHDRAIAIYKSSLNLLRTSLGRG